MADFELSKKGNRQFDLNVVPFIDLLSVLILFLLMTSVYRQLGSLPLPLASEEATSRIITQASLSTTPGRINVYKHSIILTLPDQATSLEIASESEDWKARIKEQLASKKTSRWVLTPFPESSYGRLVEILEVVKDVGIENIFLNTKAS